MTLPADDERRYEAALLVAARLWERRNSPQGVAGGFEGGPIYVRFKDPDVEQLLVGLRSTSSDVSAQTWPTIAELRTHIGANSTTAPDAVLQSKLDAAIAYVTDRLSGFGIS